MINEKVIGLAFYTNPTTRSELSTVGDLNVR